MLNGWFLGLLTASFRPGDPPLWGVNVHLNPSALLPGEVSQVARAFALARRDLPWGEVEPTAGAPRAFGVYDAWHAALAAEGVRAYFILDYNNPAVPGCGAGAHDGPRTGACRAAFAAFAVAAMLHFEHAAPRPIFELWNEPDTGAFWTVNGTAPPSGSPGSLGNASEYAALAAAVDAERAAAGLKAPHNRSTLVGPAVARFGENSTWAFLEQCAALGVFGAFDALSAHAYRASSLGPESALPDFARLRALSAAHSSSGGAPLPLVSGEWGWTTCTPSATAPNCPSYASVASEADAAKLLARQFLSNSLAGVVASIYYDYADDCADDGDRECRFGTVRQGATGNASAPHVPKPAYRAAEALARLLGGRRVLGRTPAHAGGAGAAHAGGAGAGAAAAAAVDEGAFALRFEGGALAVWTADGPAAACDAPLAAVARSSCPREGGHAGRAACEAAGCCYATTGYFQCFAHPTLFARTLHISMGAAAAAQCWSVLDLFGQPRLSSASGSPSEQEQQQQQLCCANGTGFVTLNASDSVLYLMPVQ